MGVPTTEVQVAIQRLLRLGLLVVHRKQLVKAQIFTSNYSEGFTAPALKELQRQLIQKALDAIDHVPQEQKDITAMTMAIDPTKLTEAKRRIKVFRRELSEFMESGAQTTVYNLGIQLIPLSDASNQGENCGS